MARAKPKKREEPEFVGPPRIAEIKKTLTPEDLEMLRGIPDFDPDAIIPGEGNPRNADVASGCR